MENHFFRDVARFPLWRGAVFFSLFIGIFSSVSVAETVLPQEVLADLVKPSVVRVAEHITGTAKIPEIQVDIRRRFVAVVPRSFTEIPVDEYLMGSGFVVHPDGYVATNAHVVSEETVKQMLASERALSALYENALFLSDTEMQEFLRSETEDSFSREVLDYLIRQSVFDLKREVAVLRPESEKKDMPALLEEGFPATIVSVNDRFFDDEKDVAILKIDEGRLPALSLGDSNGLTVGKKAFIFGFPATAELNQRSSTEATFTQGIVSAIRQSTGKDFRIFQTDAKVSEGSSGGPLFDEHGDVVGIVTFQTGELDRAQGDNFAFALPVEMIEEALVEASIVPVAGAYGNNFRQGFAEFILKRCDRAKGFFRAATEGSSGAFVGAGYLRDYLGKCDEWQRSGQSLDTRFDELKNTAMLLGNPFIYMAGAGLFLFGIFGAALFWILRQVRREERELEALEERVRGDEIRIRAYKMGMVSHADEYPGSIGGTIHDRSHTKPKKTV